MACPAKDKLNVDKTSALHSHNDISPMIKENICFVCQFQFTVRHFPIDAKLVIFAAFHLTVAILTEPRSLNFPKALPVQFAKSADVLSSKMS